MMILLAYKLLYVNG